MVPGIDGVDALFLGLMLQLLDESLGNAVHTTHRRHNPDLITYTDITVLSDIALKGTVLLFDAKFLAYRIISILKCTSEIGLQIVLIHPITSLQILNGMANRIAVFDDVGTLRGIFNQHFVTSGCILIQDNLLTVYLNDSTFLLGLQAYHNAVGRINFQVSCLFHFSFLCFSK